MNIFYFNITYTCSSNCVFCYSHNTIHSGHVHNEISPEDLLEYLREYNVQPSDRVIINGGEPFLHSKILTILKSLGDIGCEVLIYTNGRHIKHLDLSFLRNNFRFIVPIHGHKILHDKISRCDGSFVEMEEGLKHLSNYGCKVDLKIILNPFMISSHEEFNKTLVDIDSLIFNNAVHVTKMADTVISKKNGIPTVTEASTSEFNKIIFDHYAKRGIVLKFFDTCIKDIPVINFYNRDLSNKVYFKDWKAQWKFNFYTPDNECRKNCSHKEFCQSAVGNYTVLEYNGKFYKGLE